MYAGIASIPTPEGIFFKRFYFIDAKYTSLKGSSILNVSFKYVNMKKEMQRAERLAQEAINDL